jgi:hypothetical protein
MSTVKRLRVERDKNGALSGVTSFEIDEAVYAQQEAAKRFAAEIAATGSRAGYEQVRDWLVRQVEVTMSAVVEGRACELASRDLGVDRPPNDHAKNLATIILSRVSHAILKEQIGDVEKDPFLESLPEKDALPRAITGFIDAAVGVQMSRIDKRALAAAPMASRAGVPLGQYQGVWRSGFAYEKGDVVTDHGSAWICLKASPTRPGSTPDWRLIHKGDLGTGLKHHKGAVKL